MEITGDIVSPNDRLCYRLSGFWDKNLVRIRTTGEREMLVNGDNLRRYPDYFGFNSFTMGLNEPDTGLPPSDSRNRMDMRALEQGNLTVAGKHKRLLEEHQRARNKVHHKPLWFESVRDEASNKSIYFPNSKYWEAKRAGFADVKDIVGLHTDG